MIPFHRTDSGIRLPTFSAPVHTTHRLSEASEAEANFPSLSLRYIHLTLKHKHLHLSIRKISFFQLCEFIRKEYKFSQNLRRKNIWLFVAHMLNYCQYRKRLWRRRSGSSDFQRVSIWCKLITGRHQTHHFRAGAPSFVPGSPVCPR